MKFVFDAYELDPDRRELTRDAAVVSIGPQVFDVLVHLVLNRDRIVTKDDLIENVWGGRIVSESTLTSHINAVRKALSDTGEEQRLIRTVARKGYRFVGEVQERGPTAHAVPAEMPEPIAQALRSPEHPSIAVLPFLNLSGDPGQDYLVDGVVEDIIVALSRTSWLFVIARNSSFTYKGRKVDARQVGRELGVRYVLEGSLRKAANRVRITGQLVDATTNTNLWSERFEGEITDIFDLQDSVAERVVGAMAPELQHAEIERAKRKPTESLDAYDYYLRGMAGFHEGTKDSLDRAVSLFLKAIELDPGYPSAYGMAAFCYYWRKISGWTSDRAREIAEGARLSRLAIELGEDDPVALTRGGHALGHFGGDLNYGIALLDRALVLNPNFAVAWYLSGYQRISRGTPDEGIERFERAMKLSPLDAEMVRMQTGMTMCHLFAGRFDAASSWADKASQGRSTFLVAFSIIAAAHALAGRIDAAKLAMSHCRRITPALRISNLEDWVLLKRPEDLATLADGLRRAGLPE